MDGTTFIHFNDVYNAEKSPRFVHALKSARTACCTDSISSSRSRTHVFTCFSGDAFSPSIMSTIVRGEQMVPVLNALGIDAACLGNHDLDFGLREFNALRAKCNFPWLCSNARSVPDDGRESLGGCEEYVILDKSTEGGPKVLVLGLIEAGWIETLSTINPEDVEFEDPSEYVKRRVPEILEGENGGKPFDAVVALTHMRMPNDRDLAKKCGGGGGGGDRGIDRIDLILGGHDHHYEDSIMNGVRVLNSGCDFRTFTIIDVSGRESDGNDNGGTLLTTTTKVTVPPDGPEDPAVVDAIKDIQSLVEQSMDVVIGRTKVPLDGRFSEIRTRETNISNFLGEVMTRATDADVAILNAGTIRADRILDPGEITVRDLCDLLPQADEISVIELTGEKLLKALENGVGAYPAMEGRFPCVDGVRFAFNPDKPPGERIVLDTAFVRDRPGGRDQHALTMRRRGQQQEEVPQLPPPSPSKKTPDAEENGNRGGGEDDSGNSFPQGYSPLDLKRTYSVVSKTYLLAGKDGYEAFVDAPILREAEDCPVLPTMVRNVFTELHILRRWAGLTSMGKVIKSASRFKKLVGGSVVDPFAICPMVDGRIRNVKEEQHDD